VGHLVAHVLAESQLAWVHSNTDQELLNAGHKIAQSLVGNQTLSQQMTILIACLFIYMK
jgi:hypothetical protein